MEGNLCELCPGQADIYCTADSAFLCWNCDRNVHNDNFLVARHARLLVCSGCKSILKDYFTGGGITSRVSYCKSCASSYCQQQSGSDNSCISTCDSSSSSSNFRSGS